MPVYKWKGRTRGGKITSGEMEAVDNNAVVAQLRKQEIMALSVRTKPKEITIPGFGSTIKDKDLVIYTRQFTTMIDAGLPIVQTLDILGQQTENSKFAKIINEVRKDVEEGATYADALRKHPKVFSDLYCNMVEAGETGGILDIILNRLSAYMEKAIALKRKVRSAMVYPGVISSVAILVVIVLMVFVIPVFAKMLATMGTDLPLPTKIVLGISNFFKKYIFFLIIALVIFIFLFRRYYRTHDGRRTVDAILLKLPVFGSIIRKVAVAKFCRTLGTLISSGVTILDALDITAKTAGNSIVEDAVIATRISISEGKTIYEPLNETKVFPPMVVQMIAVGEKTGALDTMLDKISDFYDEEVDVAVSNLTQLMEPMLMVFLGVVIGFIVVAMYMPMFKLIGELAGG